MRALFWILLAATGCSDKIADTGDDSASGDAGQGDTDPPPEEQESASSFTEGSYRTSSLAILTEPEDGIDLDGDKEPDNQLPTVLSAVDLLGLVAADMSPDGVNATIAQSIEDGDIIQLIEASQVGALLTVDLLLGLEDEEGTLTVDPASYEGGEPTSRLQGTFSTETAFDAAGDSIQIPFSFYPDEPPLFIPVLEAVLVGELGADAAGGNLYGIIPVDAMMTQVIEPLIPTGEDYNPDDYLGMEREDLLAYIEDVANKTLSDIELEDGSKGVSAAMRFEAGAADW